VFYAVTTAAARKIDIPHACHEALRPFQRCEAALHGQPIGPPLRCWTPLVVGDLEHARRAGLPVDRVSEIALEVSPAMFR
jgi:hypothetical protein